MSSTAESLQVKRGPSQLVSKVQPQDSGKSESDKLARLGQIWHFPRSVFSSFLALQSNQEIIDIKIPRCVPFGVIPAKLQVKSDTPVLDLLFAADAPGVVVVVWVAASEEEVTEYRQYRTLRYI